jgi:hypothetical protein
VAQPRALRRRYQPVCCDVGLDFSLLGLGHSEFVKCLLEVIKKNLPLRRLRNHATLPANTSQSL